MTRSPDERMRSSWEENAASWTSAVRGGCIPSRLAGTDAAILRACRRYHPTRVLDVGCGEGWLTRAIASETEVVVGIDASVPLVEAARSEGGGPEYEVLDYASVSADPTAVQGPWDAIVCNFALLDENVTELLSALRARLAAGGRLLIQTVHPDNVADGGKSGWREETFDSFGVRFPAAMPWFFRTRDDWAAVIQTAGLRIASVEEPLHASTGKPLSLLFECRAGDR